MTWCVHFGVISILHRVWFLVMFGYNEDIGSFGKNQSMSIQRFSHFANTFGNLKLMQIERFSKVLGPRWYLKCPWDIVKGKVVLKAGPLSVAVFISFPQHPLGFPVSHSSYFPQVFCFVCLFFLSFFSYMSTSKPLIAETQWCMFLFIFCLLPLYIEI